MTNNERQHLESLLGPLSKLPATPATLRTPMGQLAEEAATGPIAHRPGVLHRVEEGLRADYPPSRQVDPQLKGDLDKINTILEAARSHRVRS